MIVSESSSDSVPDNTAASLDESATVSSLGNDSVVRGSIPKKRTPRGTGTNKTKPKRAKTHHSEDWERLIPDDNGVQHDIRGMTPSKWPHLPQLGNRKSKGHICALCYTKGHHSKYCPNVAWAIIFGAVKKFIPSGVRNHVAGLRGYDIKMEELQGFIDPKYLRQMTAAYGNGSMPSALRGTPFTDRQFEKAPISWTNIQQKIKDGRQEYTRDSRGRGGKSVRSGDSSSASSKRTAAIADVGSDEGEGSELGDQDDDSFVDDSSEEK